MEKFSKAICGAASYIFTYLTKTFNEIFVILAILMMFDYIMGMIIAIKKRKFNYKIGVWGALKKLLYIMMLTTGYLTDFLLNYLLQKAGLDFKTYGSLGFVVTFYLIGNEGISLCYHWAELGLPVPKIMFLIFNKFKSFDQEGDSNEKQNTKISNNKKKYRR